MGPCQTMVQALRAIGDSLCHAATGLVGRQVGNIEALDLLGGGFVCLQTDATEHIDDVLSRIKPEYLVRSIPVPIK